MFAARGYCGQTTTAFAPGNTALRLGWAARVYGGARIRRKQCVTHVGGEIAVRQPLPHWQMRQIRAQIGQGTGDFSLTSGSMGHTHSTSEPTGGGGRLSIPLGLVSVYLLWARPNRAYPVVCLFYGFFFTHASIICCAFCAVFGHSTA